MDRVKVYINEVPWRIDNMGQAKSTSIALSRFMECIIGSVNSLNGLQALPSTPPALSVEIQTGELYTLQQFDQTIYGPLPADTTEYLKQAIVSEPVSFNTPAPLNPGNSIKYLVEIGYEQIDTDLVNRPFFMAASQDVNTTRKERGVLNLLTGTEAPTGTEVTPTPTAGFEGMWVITVAFGQTTVTAPDIAVYPNAPFILEKLQDKISLATADANFLTPAEGNAEYARKPNIAPTAAYVQGDGSSVGISPTPTILPLVAALGMTAWISGNTFTAPYDGMLEGKAFIQYETYANNRRAQFYWYLNGASIIWSDSNFEPSAADGEITIGISQYLLAGDTIRIEGSVSGDTGAANIANCALTFISG